MAPPAPSADSSTATPALGERVFEEHCSLCHGTNGDGHGPASAGLNPRPRDLRDAGYMRARSDRLLLQIIRNGKGAMPAWGRGGTLSEDEIQAVLARIREMSAHP